MKNMEFVEEQSENDIKNRENHKYDKINIDILKKSNCLKKCNIFKNKYVIILIIILLSVLPFILFKMFFKKKYYIMFKERKYLKDIYNYIDLNTMELLFIIFHLKKMKTQKYQLL